MVQYYLCQYKLPIAILSLKCSRYGMNCYLDASSIHFVSTCVHEDTKVNKILMHVSHNDLNKQLC
jgi:hypothetical protein